MCFKVTRGVGRERRIDGRMGIQEKLPTRTEEHANCRCDPESAEKSQIGIVSTALFTNTSNADNKDTVTSAQ